jgi:O-antigen/teichoic acid export membrane protein
MAGLIALVVAQNMLAVMFESVMQSVNQWRDAKLIRVVRTLLETALLYWVLSYQRVEYLLLVTTGVNLLYLISLYAYARRHVVFRLTLGCLKWKNLLVQLKDSFWYFQNTIASVITFNFQIIMMSHLLTAAQMTIYLLVFRFFEIIRAGLTNFAMLLFPSITSRQKMGDWIGLQQYYTRAIIAVSIIVGLTMSAVLIWGDEVFVYWSKEQSSIALSLFFVYGIYVGLLVIDHVSVVFVSALKFNRNTSVMSSVQSVLLIILTYVFIRQYGVLGAAFASVTAFVTTSLWYNPFHLWRKMRGLAN